MFFSLRPTPWSSGYKVQIRRLAGVFCGCYCCCCVLSFSSSRGFLRPPPPLPPRFISYCFISSHMLLLLLPAARRGFLVRLRLRLYSCSMPSMCPLVASSAFGLPFLICMLPLPFASLSSCPDACGLLFLSHVPCLVSLFCLLPFVEVGPALRPRIVFCFTFHALGKVQVHI